MPDYRRLVILTDLRTKARITLTQMAEACGLHGKAGRESVRAWEVGQSIPQKTRRRKVMYYLWYVLRLKEASEQFRAVWAILAEQWVWDDLSEDEWHDLHADLASTAMPHSQSQAPAQRLESSTNGAEATHLPLPMPATLPPGSRVPYQRNPKFVGRVEELHAIAAALQVGTTAAIAEHKTAAATGLGGIGKTQLAVEFVHRYGQFYPGGVFWLSFADPASVVAEVAACGDGDHLALHAGYSTLTRDEQVRLVRAAWEHDSVRLLIFDNCEDPVLLQQWRPKRGGCRVLLTSRRASWTIDSQVWILPLSTLAREQSVALLRQHCPNLPRDEPSLIAIAAELDDLPLALHLAGGFLARNYDRIAPTPYLDQLRSIDQSAARRWTYTRALEHPSLRSGGVSPSGHDQHVARTFALSFDLLDPRRDLLAHHVLASIIAFAPGEPVPIALLVATLEHRASSEDCAEALNRLTDLGLLEIVRGNQTVRAHRLIVAYVQQVLPSSVQDDAQNRVESVMVKTVGELNAIMDHARVLALEVHLRAITDRAIARQSVQAAALCDQLGDHLLEIESFNDAEQYFLASIAIRTREHGEEHVSLAAPLHRLGWLYDSQGHSRRAIPLHRRGLALRESAYGETTHATTESLNYLGTVLHATGAFEEAAHLYERALHVREQLLGELHQDTAQSLNNLGLLLIFLGRYAEALAYLLRAAHIRQHLPYIGPKLAITLNNVGYALRKMARYDEARQYHERALAMREALYGPEHTYVALSLNHLGRLLHALGDYHGAEPYLMRALAIRQVQLPESPWLSNNLSNVGMLLLDQAKYEEAKRYVKEGLAMNQRIWGDEHWHTARSLNHLGLIYVRLGSLHQAYPLFEQAHAIRARQLGYRHPDTANTLAHLGICLHNLGKLKKGHAFVEQAVEHHTRNLDQNHPYLARSLMYLGSIWIAAGDAQKGKIYIQQALSTYERMLGHQHPFTVACRALIHI